MQTFLPLPPEFDRELNRYSFRNSARVLDGKRLNKQTVEAKQIFNIVCGNPSKWRNHPAVLQWMEYGYALRDYLEDMCVECIQSRHYKNSIYCELMDMRQRIPADSLCGLPIWMLNDGFHASHRSRLLFKGRVDAAILALKTRHLPRGYKVNDFLEKAALPKPNIFTQQDIQTLEELLHDNNIQIGPNYYAQFNWQEPDNIPYVWPVRKAVNER